MTRSIMIVGLTLLVTAAIVGCSRQQRATTATQVAVPSESRAGKIDVNEQSPAKQEPPATVSTSQLGETKLVRPDNEWTSEQFSEQATKQLKRLAQRMGDRSHLTAEAFAELTTRDVQCSELRPQSLEVVYEDESSGIEVRRHDSSPPDRGPTVTRVFADAIEALLAPCGESPVDVQLKLVSVVLTGDGADTTVHYHANTRAPEGAERAVQQNAIWQHPLATGGSQSSADAVRRRTGSWKLRGDYCRTTVLYRLHCVRSESRGRCAAKKTASDFPYAMDESA